MFFLQDFMHLSKEVTSLRDALTEREDEVHELKAERNNTRVSIIRRGITPMLAIRLTSTV